MIEPAKLSDVEIRHRIALLRERAEACPPHASLVHSLTHWRLLRQVSALQDEEQRRRLRARPVTPARSLDYSSGRRKRRGVL